MLDNVNIPLAGHVRGLPQTTAQQARVGVSAELHTFMFL
jgi:hypothetical protein